MNQNSNATAKSYIERIYKEKTGLDHTNGGTSENTEFLDGEGGSRADYVVDKVWAQFTEAENGTFDTRFVIGFSGDLNEYENLGMTLVVTRTDADKKETSATYNRSTTTVYKSLKAAGDTVYASSYGYDYFYVIVYSGLPTTDYTFSATITLNYTLTNSDTAVELPGTYSFTLAPAPAVAA